MSYRINTASPPYSMLVILFCLLLSVLPSATQQSPIPPKPTPEVQKLIDQALQANLSGRYKEGITLFQRVLEKAQTISDLPGQAWGHAGVAYARSSMGQMEEALPEAYKALKIYQDTGNTDSEAFTLNMIADIHGRLFQWEKALEWHQKALEVSKRLHDPLGPAFVLNNMGGLYLRMAQYPEAIEHLQQALKLREEKLQKDARAGGLVAETLNNIGTVHERQARYAEAIKYYQLALDQARRSTSPSHEAMSLLYLGMMYDQVHMETEARAYFQQAEAKFRALNNPSRLASTLNQLASLSKKDKPSQAFKLYDQALEAARAAGDPASEADILSNIGLLHLSLLQYPQALGYLEPALVRHKAIGNIRSTVITLYSLGTIYSSQGNQDRADESWEEAIRLARNQKERQVLASALSVRAYMRTFRQKRFALAERDVREACELIDAIRQDIGVSPDAKIAFMDEWSKVYDLAVHLLLQRNQIAQAFEFVQRAKAQSLLELMAGGGLEITKEMSEAEKQEEKHLRSKLLQLSQQLREEATRLKPSDARQRELQTQWQQAGKALQEFRERLYALYPRLKAARAEEAISLQTVSKFLPEDTALLEYISLKVGTGTNGLDTTVLFCMTRQREKTLVKAYPLTVKSASLTQLVMDYRASCVQPDDGDNAYRRLGPQLYRKLLTPAAAQLAGKKRLLICPDGPLWELPFAALWLGKKVGTEKDFLLWRYPIGYAYSATAAYQAWKLHRDPKRPRPTGTMLALIAPDFGGQAARKPFGLATNLGGVELSTLNPQESGADGLRKQFGANAVKVGRAAQETLVKRQGSRHRFLHFFTHGFCFENAPMLGFVALAEPPATDPEDGFLTAQEIMQMNLLGTEMVALPICDSGQGKIHNGEGMVGLLWALFVAGVPTQMVSSWSVNATETQKLMARFYARLWSQGKVVSRKDEALRGAMLETIQQGSFHPYYWSAFRVVGDVGR